MLDYEKNIPKIRYIIKKILPLHTELERKEFCKKTNNQASARLLFPENIRAEK